MGPTAGRRRSHHLPQPVPGRVAGQARHGPGRMAHAAGGRDRSGCRCRCVSDAVETAGRSPECRASGNAAPPVRPHRGHHSRGVRGIPAQRRPAHRPADRTGPAAVQRAQGGSAGGAGNDPSLFRPRLHRGRDRPAATPQATVRVVDAHLADRTRRHAPCRFQPTGAERWGRTRRAGPPGRWPAGTRGLARPSRTGGGGPMGHASRSGRPADRTAQGLAWHQHRVCPGQRPRPAGSAFRGTCLWFPSDRRWRAGVPDPLRRHGRLPRRHDAQSAQWRRGGVHGQCGQRHGSGDGVLRRRVGYLRVVELRADTGGKGGNAAGRRPAVARRPLWLRGWPGGGGGAGGRGADTGIPQRRPLSAQPHQGPAPRLHPCRHRRARKFRRRRRSSCAATPAGECVRERGAGQPGVPGRVDLHLADDTDASFVRAHHPWIIPAWWKRNGGAKPPASASAATRSGGRIATSRA